MYMVVYAIGDRLYTGQNQANSPNFFKCIWKLSGRARNLLGEFPSHNASCDHSSINDFHAISYREKKLPVSLYNSKNDIMYLALMKDRQLQIELKHGYLAHLYIPLYS